GKEPARSRPSPNHGPRGSAQIGERRLGEPVGGRLPPRAPLLESVQSESGEDSRQPRAEVVDARCVRTAEAQPRFLNCVVGFSGGAEHPAGDGGQACTLFLKALAQKLALGLVTFSPSGRSWQ